MLALYKNLFALSCAFSLSNFAFSDEGLVHFRESFEDMLQNAIPQFDRANQMKPVVLKLGSKMRKKDCVSFVAKIKKNYKVNPFGLVNKEGWITNGVHMCGEPEDWDETFIQTVSGKNQFGIPYVAVLQQDDKSIYEGSYRTTTNFFIGTDYRIIEVQEVTLGDKNNPSEYEIKSMDEMGNVYVSWFRDGTLLLSSTNQENDPDKFEYFIPANGMVISTLTRYRAFDKKDGSTKGKWISMTRNDTKDWTDYVIPVTRGTLGGYYLYQGSYVEFWELDSRSELMITYKNGKEYCTWGRSRVAGRWTDYPHDATELPNDCW